MNTSSGADGTEEVKAYKPGVSPRMKRELGLDQENKHSARGSPRQIPFEMSEPKLIKAERR